MKISVFGVLSEHTRRPLHLVHISTPYKAIAQALPTGKRLYDSTIHRLDACLWQDCNAIERHLRVDGAEERKSSIVRY